MYWDVSELEEREEEGTRDKQKSENNLIEMLALNISLYSCFSVKCKAKGVVNHKSDRKYRFVCNRFIINVYILKNTLRAWLNYTNYKLNNTCEGIK